MKRKTPFLFFAELAKGLHFQFANGTKDIYRKTGQRSAEKCQLRKEKRIKVNPRLWIKFYQPKETL